MKFEVIQSAGPHPQQSFVLVRSLNLQGLPTAFSYYLVGVVDVLFSGVGRHYFVDYVSKKIILAGIMLPKVILN